MASEDIPQTRPIVTRKAAITAGLKRFFTGVPCKYGHISERSVSGYWCCACNVEQGRIGTFSPERAQRRRAQAKARKIKHRDKVLAQKRASNERNRETRHKWGRNNKDKVNASNKRQYAKNRQRAIEYSRTWRANNKERHRANLADWASRNVIQMRALRAARQARKRGAAGRWTKEDIDRIHKAQRGKCAYCRCKLRSDFHIDHIIPLVSGGTNFPRNLQLTCGVSGNRCNMHKHDKDPLMFARELGWLL